MQGRIFYLGFYNNKVISQENRKAFPAADTKMEYIISVLTNFTQMVHVISASGTQNIKWVTGSLTKLDDRSDLKTFNSLGTGCRVKRVMGRYWLKLQLLQQIAIKQL